MAAEVRATAIYQQVAHKDFGEVRATAIYQQVAHKDFGEVRVTALFQQVASTYGDLDEPLPVTGAPPRRILTIITS